jgi:hypothetical protein
MSRRCSKDADSRRVVSRPSDSQASSPGSRWRVESRRVGLGPSAGGWGSISSGGEAPRPSAFRGWGASSGITMIKRAAPPCLSWGVTAVDDDVVRSIDGEPIFREALVEGADGVFVEATVLDLDGGGVVDLGYVVVGTGVRVRPVVTGEGVTSGEEVVLSALVHEETVVNVPVVGEVPLVIAPVVVYEEAVVRVPVVAEVPLVDVPAAAVAFSRANVWIYHTGDIERGLRNPQTGARCPDHVAKYFSDGYVFPRWGYGAHVPGHHTWELDDEDPDSKGAYFLACENDSYDCESSYGPAFGLCQACFDDEKKLYYYHCMPPGYTLH